MILILKLHTKIFFFKKLLLIIIIHEIFELKMISHIKNIILNYDFQNFKFIKYFNIIFENNIFLMKKIFELSKFRFFLLHFDIEN